MQGGRATIRECYRLALKIGDWTLLPCFHHSSHGVYSANWASVICFLRFRLQSVQTKKLDQDDQVTSSYLSALVHDVFCVPTALGSVIIFAIVTKCLAFSSLSSHHVILHNRRPLSRLGQQLQGKSKDNVLFYNKNGGWT